MEKRLVSGDVVAVTEDEIGRENIFVPEKAKCRVEETLLVRFQTIQQFLRQIGMLAGLFVPNRTKILRQRGVDEDRKTLRILHGVKRTHGRSNDVIVLQDEFFQFPIHLIRLRDRKLRRIQLIRNAAPVQRCSYQSACVAISAAQIAMHIKDLYHVVSPPYS